MSKGLTCGAIGFVILGISLLLGASGSTSATSPAESKDVLVVNTPSQPVPTTVTAPVTLAGTPGVQIVNAPDVVVANSTANPVNVRDLSKGDLSTFHVTFTIGLGSKSSLQNFDLLPGKRFVIHSVSLNVTGTIGQKFLGRLVTLSSGNTVTHYVTMDNQGSGLGDSTSDIHTGHRQLLGHADYPGPLALVMYRNDDAGTALVSGALTGYWVDLP